MKAGFGSHAKAKNDKFHVLKYVGKNNAEVRRLLFGNLKGRKKRRRRQTTKTSVDRVPGELGRIGLVMLGLFRQI